MTAPGQRYPFVVPGHELDPNQPLCPWRKDNVINHEPYYRDVGGHEKAYSGFTNEVVPAHLCRTGAVVVVGGPPQSGKSSLINRCIFWVEQQVHDAKKTPVHILNLAGYRARGPSVEERTAYVAELIATKLLPLKKPAWAQKQLDEKKTVSIESILLLLNGLRDSDLLQHTFLIVPPPLDFDTARQEIDRYRGCVQPGVICMLEHVTGHVVPSANPSTRMDLRHLEPGEAYEMVEKWPDTTAASPPILKDVMDEFEELFTGEQGGKLSTGMLLATLREMYRRRIRGDSEFRQVDSIELQEVMKTMLWVVANQSGGRGNPLS
jgi:hypothetical protein